MRPDEREAMWRERIAAWRRSGESGLSYCAKQGWYLKSFYTWRRRFAGKGGKQPRPSARDFVPVKRAEATDAVRIEIGVAAIIVTEQTSAAALRAALGGFGILG